MAVVSCDVNEMEEGSMKALIKPLQTLVALLLLAALGWGLWWLGGKAVAWFGHLDTPTRTGLLTLFGILMVPLITFATQFYLGQRQSREQAIRDRRTQFYDKVIELFMDIMRLTKSGEPLDQTEYEVRFRKLYAEMLTYASPAFIRSWNRYNRIANGALMEVAVAQRGAEAGAELSTFLSMAALEDVLVELRKDLGHKVKEANYGNLISVFVTDLDATKIAQIKSAKKFLDQHQPK